MSIIYLYRSGNAISCGKNMLVVNEKPFDQKRCAGFLKDLLKGKFFKFVKVDI